MATSLTVPKILNYPPSMNYQLLRREGLRHIERLGSAIWTDFNSHDPGVTKLEVLCYALTDLGYRTALPDVDLFTPSDNRKAFFTAAEIMPNAPVTALDFRKILIDMDGVKNAWLEGSEEAAVLFQLLWNGEVEIPSFLEKYILSFCNLKPVDFKIKFNFSNESELITLINAIEKVRNSDKKIELKQKTEEFFAKWTFTQATINDFKPLILWAIETRFDEIEQYFRKLILDEKIDNTRNNLKVFLNDLKQINTYLKTLWILSEKDKIAEETKNINSLYDKAENVSIFQAHKQFFIYPITICYLLKNKLTINKIPEKKEDIKYNLFLPTGIYKIYLQLEEDYTTQKDKVREAARKTLHKNRALCEYFDPEIIIVDKAPIGITTNIELTPEADIVQVYAAILYAIETFLSPTVPLYSLQEMLDKYATFELNNDTFERLVDAELPPEMIANLETLREKCFVGKTTWTNAVAKAIGATAMQDYEALIFNFTQKTYESNQIYQGPLLAHGFIDDTELEAAHWRRVVYKSDLFQVLSKVENVVRVEKLTIKKCPKDDENPNTVENEWCLSFTCHCQPTLDLACDNTHFTFTKGGKPVVLSESLQYEVSDRLEQLRGQAAKMKRKGSLDLPVPTGTQRDDLAEYTSIQEEFPSTYHVGREGIISTETPLRKAQVKQLKGFLMFFDQILTNYLAQLAQVRDMLAIENAGDKLDLFQVLYDVPNIKPILKAFDQNTNWDSFKNDNNGYVAALESLTNGSDITLKLRQNQLLDHLLARFGEQFTDHILELFSVEHPLEDSDEDTEGMNDLVADKKRMLKHLPKLGALRGRGFNYQAEPKEGNAHFWDSKNVEGFKSRVLAQLGIGNWKRRTISCSPNFFVALKLETVGKTKRYRFGIKADENSKTFWLLNTASFSQPDAANKAADDFFGQAAAIEKYDIITDEQKLSYVGFWEIATGANRSKENALLLSDSMGLEKATKRKNEIINLINLQCQSDSFHVLEHILLRPIDKDYTLLKPLICSEDFSRLDPYSFWVTILVPNWVERFNNENQLAYFEQLVRSEMPAHVAIRFAKLDRTKMLTFEQTYFNWLQIKANLAPEAFSLREATNKLIVFLNDLPS